MSNNIRNSVIDALYSSDSTVVDDGEIEVYIPNRCKQCTNAIICNVLPVAIGFFRIGIQFDIKECPFFNTGQNAQG